MAYDVEFTSEAIEDLEQLTSAIQQRILSKIRWLSKNLDDLTPQALSADLSGLFKLRVGDYRIIDSFDTLWQDFYFQTTDIRQTQREILADSL